MKFDARVLSQVLDISIQQTKDLRKTVNLLGCGSHENNMAGDNALITLQAMRDALGGKEFLSQSWEFALETVCEIGINRGVGHIGILITRLFTSWYVVSQGKKQYTSVVLRKMLSSTLVLPKSLECAISAPVLHMLQSGVDELCDFGETLPEEKTLVYRFLASIELACITDSDNSYGGLDVDCAVIIILIAALDAVLRESRECLAPIKEMLIDVSMSAHAHQMRQNSDYLGAFVVDVIVESSTEEHRGFCSMLDARNLHYSCCGKTDIFSIGRWRYHIETFAPLSVMPKSGVLIRFQVCDTRPDEVIGCDPLSEGVNGRGVRILERGNRKGAQRATVISCTKAPGLIEDFAQCGAVTLFNPPESDMAVISSVIASAAGGICLIVPTDKTTRRLAQLAQDQWGERIIIAPSHDELTALRISRACAALFIPRRVQHEAADIISLMIKETASQAAAHSMCYEIPRGEDAQTITVLIRDLLTYSPQQLRMLVARDDGSDLVALTRQIKDVAGSEESKYCDLEVLNGGQDGSSLIQAII